MAKNKQEAPVDMSAWTVTLDSGVLNSYIAAIGTASKRLIDGIQKAAVSAVLRAAIHNDITSIQKLDEALGNGWYMATFRAFAGTCVPNGDKKHGPVKYMLADKATGSAAGYVYQKAGAAALKAEHEADAVACVTRLLAYKWETAKKETEYNGFDLQQILARAVKKGTEIQNDPEKSNHEKTKIDPAMLDMVRNLLASHASKQGGGNPEVEVDTVH